jgi:hypothetical protein
MKFTPTLAPRTAKIAGGYSSNGIIDPDVWADEIFGAGIQGPWLAVYMLRRFGWPNAGSDDYKNLCSWCLTTPVEGLYLLVTPYLGEASGNLLGLSSRNLHFGVRFSREVGRELNRDPEVEKHWARREKAIRRWWEREGADLYVFTEGEDTGDLVREWNTVEGKTLGLWKRPDGFTKLRTLPRVPAKIASVFWWWMAEFLEEKHPDILPEFKPKSRGLTAFQRRAKQAIETVLKDLMRPTYVRDVGFSLFGHEGGKGPIAKPFEGAGYTPEYWFSERRKRRGRKKGQGA